MDDDPDRPPGLQRQITAWIPFNGARTLRAQTSILEFVLASISLKTCLLQDQLSQNPPGFACLMLCNLKYIGGNAPKAILADFREPV